MRAVPRLNRYILRQLFGPFVFFTLSLTGVIWLTQSLQFIDWIFNKGLSTGFFFYLTLLILPGVLAIVLPISLFAAILYTYQRLSAESELVVMASSGLAPSRLARPALLLAVLITVVGYGLTLYLMPLGHRTFRALKMDLRANLSNVLLQEGTFNTVGQGLTVYIRERYSGGELRGILVHDSRDSARPTTMMAERGILVSSEEGPRLVLDEGNRQEIEYGTEQLSILHFDRYTLDLTQFVKTEHGVWLDAKDRYLHELFWPGDSPEARRDRDRLRAAGHDRLVLPLFAVVLAAMALAAILGGRPDRRGLGRRLAAVIAAALVIRLAEPAAVNLAAKHPFVVPLIYLDLLLPLILSSYFLSHERRDLRRRIGAEGSV